MISLITAIDSDGGIGKDGKIPWKCPEDMKFFKCMTQKKICLAGKSTYESLPDVAKKDRTWIRFTNKPSHFSEVKLDSDWYKNISIHCIEDFIKFSHKDFYKSLDIMLCGGAKIYKEFLDRDWVERLYITRILGKHDCDTFFPQYNKDVFKFSYSICLNASKILYVDVYDRK